ncbi:DUF2975 domain-containing protein [Ruminococcaceae bacterium OttesenSCG-928-O06]|nr:DUF2975 domain-containing protein [Ruminococcaceae bacterium OttesenSCG-928-O06]
MWNEKRSLWLSKACTLAFCAVLVAVVVAAPWLAKWLVTVAPSVQPQHTTLLLVTVYVGAVPAAALLVCLYRLLHNIGKGQVFTAKNLSLLRAISWFCFAGAAVCFASMLYYTTWGIVGVAAAFVGLIVRVVKNVLAQAMLLKEENDYTI